ncbi:Acyl-CoA synthetase (AMP-forming)/AMP-acid ligase II [Mycobacterium numidiamassiliense]|jgi:acyl-CoA synthetase (AMP-forming)/AMP-acid ligase II|uniref:Acyl-CoA synthetase (AMP-forming)/AMP-acid ligase II n=1 Tax=Mycobacterium numidiamassiliense TaxID=1841861 RepID=A0A2U3P6C9_9MYCO|nr:AMP-binding protein [Mycobacterium numidiamassiliense]SPM39307.1 Acyl-CoA synthetase (AMP-forming)/AMP-acid ligase II [Mycobacterium numidiamassiliense]
MTDGVAATTARALASSGLLTLPDPLAALRLVREVYRGGTNLYTLLGIAAARWPRRTAIIDDDGAITYRQLQAKTESLARELSQSGAGPGEAVGIMCRNGRDFAASVFAAALVGADVVLVSTEFRADALAGALSTHQIATMFCDNEFAEQVREASGSAMVIDPAAVPPEPGKRRPRVVASGRLILLTSGTTGVPKGVPRSPRMSSGLGVGMTILQRTGLRVGSRIAVAVPMFHGLGLGMLMLTVSLGGTVLTRGRFDAEAVLAQASLQRADAMSVVPIMLARILDLPQRVRARNPLPSLRAVLSSGDRLDPGLARRFMDDYGEILYNGYGSTEVGIGALATPRELRNAPETVGHPVAGCPVRIFDRNGRAVGPRVTGRIFIGGELRTDGYIGGGAKAVIDSFTSTGDMGYLDNSGRLYIVGREDDMIVSGGENVYPRALENALSAYPDVAENAVVGVADDQFGRRLAAFIVPRPDIDVDVAALREYLKGKVSRFEQPRDIHIVDTIPRNPAGKVIRKQLAT